MLSLTLKEGYPVKCNVLRIFVQHCQSPGLLVVCLLMAVCGVAAGQHAAAEETTPRVELPVTYVYERADRDPESFNLNGFAISPTFKISPRVGLVGTFSYRRGPKIREGSIFVRPSSFEAGAGIDFTVAKSGRAKFGLEAEVGGESERVKELVSNGFTITDSSPYLFLGGVIDIETSNKHVSFRLVKAGWKPTFFGNERQDNFQFETGIIFNFGRLHK